MPQESIGFDSDSARVKTLLYIVSLLDTENVV